MPKRPLPEFLARLVRNAPVPVVVTDREGFVTFWSDAAERAFGWTAAEVAERRNPAVPPERQAEFDSAVRHALSGDAQFFETTLQPREGEPFTAPVALAAIASEKTHSVVMLCLQDPVLARETKKRAEMLAFRERTFSLLLTQLPGLVWGVDQDMVITSAGGAALGAVGIEPNDVIGLHVNELVDLPASSARAVAEAVRGTPGRFECSFRGRTFDARAEPLRRGGEVIGGITIGVDVTDIRAAEQALRVSREELRRLSGGINRVQENERRRIAREIHDELGQRLTGLRIELSLLRSELPEMLSPDAETRLSNFTVQVDEALATIRRVATELRPALLDEFGLRAAVEAEVATFRGRTGLDVRLVYDVDERLLGPDAALAFYRIVQESLTNVARHAGASRVDVRMQMMDGYAELEVVDDGRGLDPTAAGARTLGLTGVRERAYALGGEVVLEGAPGRGTRVFISVPLDDPPIS